MIALLILKKQEVCIFYRESLIFGCVLLAVSWVGDNREIQEIIALNRVVKFGIPFAMIIYGSVCMELKYEEAGNKRQGVVERIFLYFDKISYSLYLTHYPMIMICQLVHLRSVLLVSVLCVLVSILAYQVIEHPVNYRLGK